MKKRFFNFMKIIIGVSILFFLVYKIGFRAILSMIESINLYYLPPIFLFYFTSFALGSYAIKLLADPLKKGLPYFKILKYYLLKWALSLLLPGRVGEASLIYFLKKEGIEVGGGTALFLLDKLITLLFLVITAIFSFFLFFSFSDSIMLAIITLFFSLIGLFFIFSRIGSKKYLIKVISNAAVTLVKLIVDSVVTFLLFISLGEVVPIWIIFIITSVIVILSLIPLSVNGLGIRESVAVFLYSKIGVEAAVVVGAYILLLIINYLIALVCLSLFTNEELIPRLDFTTPNTTRE